MDLRIQGKVALITGAGRGLGRNISLCLAEEGVTIIACSRSEETLLSLLKELHQIHPSSHLSFPLDLSQTEASKKLIHFLHENQIQPDIVVHNVGGNLNITDPLCSLEQWQAVMRINVELPVELNRSFIPGMQKKGWGRICHVSSVAGLENQGPPSYCSAKAALIAYTRSLGRYVAKDGIAITSVLPGAVFTHGGYWDIASKERPEHVRKYLTERMAIQRFGKPNEIGKIVTFLCSDHASFCIGSAFLADGGQGKAFFAQASS